MPQSTTSNAVAGDATVLLRVLKTTDVHAHLTPFDYDTGRDDRPLGLTRVATLIAQARSEVQNSLLFDNGDFLQGAPMGELGMLPGSDWEGDTPTITAMNHLGYDTANLGNHEFNYGLDALEKALSEARFPVVSANARWQAAEPNRGAPYVAPWLILPRRVVDTAGHLHDICIGILGLLPPEVAQWDHAHLSGQIETCDMVDTARFELPRLRAAGADIVLALAHTGFDHDGQGNQAALDIAALDGIDVVLAGHTHHSFPSDMMDGIAGVDSLTGTFHGKPAVMAGHNANSLGLIDLELHKGAAGWRIAGHRPQLRPANVPADPALTNVLAPAHQHILRGDAQVVSRSPQPLTSYWWMLGHSTPTHLVAEAKRAALSDLLKDQGMDDIPVMATATTYQWGGRSGPAAYHDVPAGDITQRNIASLYEFPNTLAGLWLTGADLRLWLERAAALFCTLSADAPDQPLIDPAMPGHNFDIVTGASYDIDLGHAALFDSSGQRIGDGPGRIRNLRHGDQPIPDDMTVALAVNNYRAFGGGGYPTPKPEMRIALPPVYVRDALTQHLQAAPVSPPVVADFNLIAAAGTTATFETGPGVRRHVANWPDMDLTDLGPAPNGFVRLRIRF